jgi:hypothetical protein
MVKHSEPEAAHLSCVAGSHGSQHTVHKVLVQASDFCCPGLHLPPLPQDNLPLNPGLNG